MKKQLTEEQINEINFMVKFCKIVLEYIAVKRNDNSYTELTDYNNIKYTANYLKACKNGFNDIIAWSDDFPKEYITDLNDILKKELNITLTDLKTKANTKIDLIINHKKIKNLEEFYFAKNYYDSIADDNNYTEKSNILSDIIFEYETKKLQVKSNTKKSD